MNRSRRQVGKWLLLGAGAATVTYGLHRSGRLKSGPLGLEVSSRQHDRPQKIPGTLA